MGGVASLLDELARAASIRREQNRMVVRLPEYVEELNALTQNMKDKDQFRLSFTINYSQPLLTGFFLPPPPPPTVSCDKVHVPTMSVSESWSLDVKEFHHIYLLIQMQKHIMHQTGDIVSTVDSIRSGGASVKSIDEHTCCICLETREEIVLACMHTYCRNCLDQWLQRSSTCPMCRVETTTDDGWEISDAPKRLAESAAGDELTAAAAALGVHKLQPSTSV